VCIVCEGGVLMSLRVALLLVCDPVVRIPIVPLPYSMGFPLPAEECFALDCECSEIWSVAC
jgi:hypothetical protein